MTDKLLEQVSALADDELGSREAEVLLARLERDPRLRDAWERYHLLGEAMRGGMAGIHQQDFAARVATAIEHEPETGRRLERARAILNLRPLAGLAIAASVAMVAVFALQEPQRNMPSEVVPMAGERPSSVPLINARRADFSGVRSPELQDQLRGYLLNHGEHSESPRFRGVMPYVQIAAHDTRPVEDESPPQRELKRTPDNRD